MMLFSVKCLFLVVDLLHYAPSRSGARARVGGRVGGRVETPGFARERIGKRLKKKRRFLCRIDFFASTESKTKDRQMVKIRGIFFSLSTLKIKMK